MDRILKIALISVAAVFVLLLCNLPGALADDYVGGLPLTTAQTGIVTGGLYMDITPAPNWGLKDVTKTFTLPDAAIGNITWARLYVSAYCGHMQNDYAFTMTNSFDGDGVSGYEHVWPETSHAPFHYQVDQGDGYIGNDNTAYGGGTNDPYKMLNDHETRVTSDYFATYDVTNMITSKTVNVNVNTVGSYDGRIKVISLIVAYNDPSSTTQTTYFVNQGHDVDSYYTETNNMEVAVGTTTFATTGLSDITSAMLYIDYMASNNGYYAFPTADNTFSVNEETGAVEGSYTNRALDRVPDVQGAYSGVDSWDVTSDVTGSSDVTFAYSRYFPGIGTAAFYKIPLAILVVKKPMAIPAPVAAFSANNTRPYVGQTVVFTDASTNTPTSWAWTIEGTAGVDYQYVDSTSASSQNPHVQFLNIGTFDVTLVASNAGGSDDEAKADYITATVPAPVAAFSATPVTGNSPLTVTFTDTSTGNPTSRVWDFGDGNSSYSTTATTVSHTYVLAGYYSVNLTVSNAGGSNSQLKANYITAKCNLAIGGIPVPSGGGANVFANEVNAIYVTLVKNTVGNSPPVKLYVYSSDGWSTNFTVPVNLSSGGHNINVGVDPTIRNAGDTVRYYAVIDPDNVVPETSETDNSKSCPIKTVIYNGYKGVQYWNGKAPPGTYLTYDIHGNVINSFGDSYYKSGKGSNWQTLTWHWNATDLPVPAGATVKAVRLYIPYCWDYEHEIWNNLTTTTFNGVTITPVHRENDTSNFGAYAQYEYGLVTYDVTGLYVKNSDNIATFTRTYWNNATNQSPLNPGQPSSISPAGFTLAVIYEDPSETEKQIFINEGWDLLGAAEVSYSTTEAEATSYQNFTGMTIDMARATKANLTTFVPWGAPINIGDPGEGNLYVNGVQIGHNVWNYGGGSDTWGETGQPQVAVDTRDVHGYLNSNGTGNGIAIQSTAGGSPCMVAERSFLVVEYPETPAIEVTLDNPSVTFANMVPGQDATGSATVNVVASHGASWSVSASDGKTTNKGYMVSGTTPLANPFQLGKDGSAYQALNADYTSFMSGTSMGSFSAMASLKQPVATGDADGTYGITITFTGSIA